MANLSPKVSKPYRPPWLDEYDLIGKIGEGTYGLVYLARNKDKSKGTHSTAIKKFKPSKEGDGVSPTAIREIMVRFFAHVRPRFLIRHGIGIQS